MTKFNPLNFVADHAGMNLADAIKEAYEQGKRDAQPEQAVKDCRNCKHGKYNDYHDTYFCYNAEGCSNWDKWETSAQPELIRCKDCKNWDTTWQNDWAKNYHYCPLIDGIRNGDWYCADAERRTE